jgi:membrane protease YdiL (CAAX protease family)
MSKRKLGVLHLVVYLVIFFALWSVRELVIRPVFLDSLNAVVSELVESLIKILIWTVPAVILVKYYQNDMWISLKEMLTTKVKKIYKYFLIPVAFLLYLLLGAWVTFGEIAIHPDLVFTRLIGAVIFVGITEEVVFRAFLLNAFLKKMKPWYAVLLTAALFIPIHYPYWIYQGFGLMKFLEGSIVVLAMSIIFSWTFIKSKNIFVPIILHMSWNLFTVIFLG